MSETLRTIEQYGHQTALDEKLFSDFEKVASFQAYEKLDGDKTTRNEQKALFLSGEITNPTLDYPDLIPEQIDNFETGLIQLKRELLSNEENETIRQAYRWRLNEKIAEARMLRAAANGDSKRFTKYSEFIYGKPSLDVFAYTTNAIRGKVEKNLTSDNIDIQIAANELLSVLPKHEKPEFTTLPDASAIELAKSNTIDELGDLINLPIESKKLSASEIKTAFDSAIDIVGADGWSVIIDEKSNKTAVSISQEQMAVKIPAERSVTKSKLEGLILHEIGTHVARRVNGERSRLKLLGLGLDRYEAGDEGVATMREQAIEGKVDDFRGLDGQLAIGLAYGLDGQPRDFRQVYDILEKYYMYTNLVAKKELVEAHEKAQTSAWNRTVRTFRGTDCKTPGACFTKDIIYREGNVGVWDVIKNNPTEMRRFNVGKYDPANPRHIMILEQLGISDADLAGLEK